MTNIKSGELEKYPSSIHQIRFPDCDPYGHLNNGRYLDYFMNAREDHLKKYYGLDIFGYFHETGKGWVVGSNEIIYRRPANLMDVVKITSQVRDYSATHIEVEMLMTSEDGRVLKSLLRANFIPFDQKTGKAAPHEPELMDLLARVKVDSPKVPIRERMAIIEKNMSQKQA